MDLRALRYFVEVVRLQGFTRAAEALHVTQPTISKMIRQLEEEVGAPLLLREGRSQRLTDVGRVVFERGQGLLGDFGRLRRELAEVVELSRGELAFGLPPMVGATFFAPLLREFGLRYPDVALRLTEDGARALERTIAEGGVELAVTVLPSPAAGLVGLEFTSEPLHVLMPRSVARVGRSTVRLAELAEQSLIFFTESFALSDRILSAFSELGLTPRIEARSGQWDFIAELVDARVGMALLPAQLCERLNPERFAHFPLVEPQIPWRLALVWEHGGYLSYAARAFVALCRSHFGLPEHLAPQPVDRA